MHRTNSGPERTHALLRESSLFEGLPDMPRALPGPNDIAYRRRSVIEGIHPQPPVVRAGEKSISASKDRAQHPELLVSLALQPIQAAANIDHRLPCRRERPPDIRTHRIIRPLQFRRPTDIVVRLRQSQSRDAEPVE